MRHRPKKHLGQNFLQDPKALAKIIEAGEIKKTDLIIEVGAGKGVLTAELARKANEVQALEVDNDLIPYLRNQFSKYPNVKIVHESVLNFRPPEKPYKVIANIPYYITSPIIRHFLHREKDKPELMVLLIQKDVAEKIVDTDESVLSLMVKIYGEPEIITYVPRTSFQPAPKVDSAVIRIRTREKLPVPFEDTMKLLKLIKMGFSSPRKTLVNNLAAGLQKEKSEIESLLRKLKIELLARPGKLTLIQWKSILSATKTYG